MKTDIIVRSDYSRFHFRSEDISHYVIDVHHGTLHVEEKDGTKHSFGPAWWWYVKETK